MSTQPAARTVRGQTRDAEPVAPPVALLPRPCSDNPAPVPQKSKELIFRSDLSARLFGLMLSGVSTTVAARTAFKEDKPKDRTLEQVISTARNLRQKHKDVINAARERQKRNLLNIPIARQEFRLRTSLGVAEEAQATGKGDLVLAAVREARKEMQGLEGDRGKGGPRITLQDIKIQINHFGDGSAQHPVDDQAEQFRKQALDADYREGTSPDDGQAGGLPSPLAAEPPARPDTEEPRVSWHAKPRPKRTTIEGGDQAYWDEEAGDWMPIDPATTEETRD